MSMRVRDNPGKIVIGMPLRNGAPEVRRAIESVLNQKGTRRDVLLLIVDDNSTDSWKEICSDLLEDEHIMVIKANIGRVYAIRNFILKYVRENMPEAEYVGRLDSDDYIAYEFALSDIEKIMDAYSPDVILTGNKQSSGGRIIRENRADKRLLDFEYLGKRLEGMARGILEDELPSCNLFVKPSVEITYRDVESAEDHWYLVDLLLNKDRYKIYIADELIYSVYNLDGETTAENKKNLKYEMSRKQLYRYFLKEVGWRENSRSEKALELLKKYNDVDYHYLGEGFSGVVYHNGRYVYKVHIPKSNNNYGEIDGLLYMVNKADALKNAIHFYPIEVIKIDDVYVIKYPYEPNEGVGRITKDEFISFLRDMWERKLVFKSITHHKNFIRSNGVLKFIDYEMLPYSDNLFLNSAARAYLYLKYPDLSEGEYHRTKRSLINNLTHPLLEGFYDFLKKLFFAVTFPDCFSEKYNSKNGVESNIPLDQINEKSLWEQIKAGAYVDSYSIETKCDGKYDIAPEISQNTIHLKDPWEKVTLLIKACPQENETLYAQLKHIVHQLSSPDIFYERVLAIDKKEGNYLREYAEGDLESLYSVVNTPHKGWANRLLHRTS